MGRAKETPKIRRSAQLFPMVWRGIIATQEGGANDERRFAADRGIIETHP